MLLNKAIESLSGKGTAACHSWRENILIRNAPIAHHLANEYLKIERRCDYIEANRWLGAIGQLLKLGRTGLKLTSSVEELDGYCKAKAAKTQRQIFDVVNTAGKAVAPNIIRQIVERTGIEFPLGEGFEQEELIAAMARVCDPRWWKRKLRPKQWREAEDFIRGLGAVNNQREIYLSNFSLHRRLEQKKSNAKLLERMEAENQDGQVYSLSELAELSPSNPVVRRAELMVRARGFENFAQQSDIDYQGAFFTLTCPSRYHASLNGGRLNPKYDGSTVAESQEHLNTVWQRVRAAWDREGIYSFGFRVVEPHHDGTPHWHLLLFIPESQAIRAEALFSHYALEEDGAEHGAAEHRLKTVLIDPTKGSATGYIAKYIAKNIDGHGLDTDLYGRNAIESAIRIEAWASIHGIRQFQQIGGASVTVYRELRRLGDADLEPGLTREITAAADSGDWEAYNTLMGGVICPRADRPLRPMMIVRESANLYGELVKVIQGIWHGSRPLHTRPHVWTVRLRAEALASNTSEDGVGFGAALSTAPPGACAPLEFCQ